MMNAFDTEKGVSLKNLSPAPESFGIYCVCSGFGFPFGTASTKRVRLFGRCLVTCGIPFHVWHIGPSSFGENKQKNGEYEGLTYEYLSPSVRRPDSVIKRILYYLWGCVLLLFRLIRHRRNSFVYVYSQGDFINLWTLFLCRLIKIPVAQEVCEWWPGTPRENFFNGWMYRSVMFRWSNGALPISHEIEARIRVLAKPDYPLCLVPVLVDPVEKNTQIEDARHESSSPVFLWCGSVDGYQRDVLFLIDALAQLTSAVGKSAVLRIVGPCTENGRAELMAYVRSKNISGERLDIAGFVSEQQLWSYCAQAEALLMPLWDDDRSCTRFPTKLGQYVAAGRPIVTALVGEMKYFLTAENAMFYPSGDAAGLARSLDTLLTNPSLGDRLASNATRDVLPKVDFRSNAKRISQWFQQIRLGF
ncbi:MAG: glycosyltransferase [Chlorobium sp.]|nr:glycosyltransferase [Chlorobium sp.]